jgi:O-antigen/teichoic acid export membrane protein
MKTLLSVYGINALAFASNLAAIFVFFSLAGPSGYGSYGIYIVFLAIYYLWETSLVKGALFARSEEKRKGLSDRDADAVALAGINGSLLPFVLGSCLLVALGNFFYPLDSATSIGGQLIVAVVTIEHLLSYPSNRLVFHLTVAQKFRTIYTFRLAATLLRHASAWGVLLVTESVYWAVIAITVKGLVIGGISVWWIAKRYAYAEGMRFRLRPTYLASTLSFFAAAAAIIVMQELPSLHIDRTYGREALGTYRLLYDMVAAIWFLATIYPTVLFSYLLSGREGNKRPKVSQPAPYFFEGLALFHLTYFLGVCALITLERSLLEGYFTHIPYAFGVAAGVSLLGYSRFLIETAQAYGLGRRVLAATLVSIAFVAIVLAMSPSEITLAEVGWAWLFGQLLFFVLLKLILLSITTTQIRTFMDATILVLPILVVTICEGVLNPLILLAICVIGVCVGLVTLLVMLRRGLEPESRVSTSTPGQDQLRK